MKTTNLLKTILNSCCTFLIGSTMYAQCTSGFTYSTDVNNCITHFTNTSSGTNLTYKWIVNSTIQPYTSSTYTATNPDLALSLGNGTTMNWDVRLFTYSSGVVCDSTQQTVSVTCGTSQTTTPCQAAYSYSTDINCVTHFFNASTGTNLSYRWDFGISADTAASPSVGFPYGSYPVTLYSYSNGIICDSLTQNVNITCNGTNTITCQAGFTVSTDANCMTNFTNISTGTNLTYNWLIVGTNTTYSVSATNTNTFHPVHLSLGLADGNYNVYLKTFSNGIFCDSAFMNITVNCAPPPTPTCNASYTYSTDFNCVTHFTNMSTGTNLTYSWAEYNNGYTLLSHNINPTLSLPNGQHIIKLYSFSSNALCDSTTQIVNVSCSGTNTASTCHASFTSQTDPITCMTSLINQSTGNNLTFAWFDIDNGYTQISSSPNPSLLLSNGIHNIGLAVFSGGTLCDSSYQAINVNCPNTTGCQVTSSISIFADPANAGNYFCYNQSTGNGVLSYLWDFGDGTTSTLQYPFHQYAQPGNYPVCLTTTNTNGTVTCTSTDCDSSSVQRMAAGFLMSSINVVPQTVTGINTISDEVSFKAYPNPITDVLNIELTETIQTTYTVVLIDAIGREVVKKEVQNNMIAINTSSLQKGYYNLLLINKNGAVVKTTKLIK